jgi:NADH dehydrogenase FAD-containing subunit
MDSMALVSAIWRGLKQAVIILVGISPDSFSIIAEIFTDTGASQLIIDKKIKLKNDSKLVEITETGLKFENGSELPADVIIFATGFVLFSTSSLCVQL